MPSPSKSRSPKKVSTPTRPATNTPRNKYDEAVHRSLEKAEGYLKKEIELHQATIRRKNNKLWQQAVLRKENEKKREISQKALQRRKVEEVKASQKAFKLKCDNEESVLLRKVYQALLRETLKFRQIEKEQEKTFVRAKEVELEHQLESLQRIFRERLESFREKAEVEVTFPMDAL